MSLIFFTWSNLLTFCCWQNVSQINQPHGVLDDSSVGGTHAGKETGDRGCGHSGSGSNRYVKAVNRIKKRLKTTEKPKKNSVKNCLRFYTREEQMDEYYCLTCKQGFWYKFGQTNFVILSLLGEKFQKTSGGLNFWLVSYCMLHVFVCV